MLDKYTENLKPWQMVVDLLFDSENEQLGLTESLKNSIDILE
jgi:hypothetical protein